MRHLKPERVEIDMFVDGFDGRWIDHPFWRSRFLVETAEQLARIRRSEVTAAFGGRTTPKRRERVEQVLETLVATGAARRDEATRGYYLPK